MRERPPDAAMAAQSSAAAGLERLLADYERAGRAWQERLDQLLREFDELERQRRTILAGAVHCATVRAPWNSARDRHPPILKLPAVLAAYERNLVQWALAQTLGNQKEAAALLGIRSTTLHEKIKRLVPAHDRPVRDRGTERHHRQAPIRSGSEDTNMP